MKSHPWFPAAQKGDVLLRDIHSATDENGFFVWWLGQSGFLFKWRGDFLLFNPYLSDSLTRKYAASDKPHIRMSEQVIDPAKLDVISVVTSSHNHTDHLDADTLQLLARANRRIELVLPEANLCFARDRLGKDTAVHYHGLDAGQSKEIGPWRFTGISAAHNEVERDDQGRCLFMGFVVEFGPFSVYHSGDTLWHENLVHELSPFSPDLAMLPINGNKPERRVAGNINGREAALLGREIGAEWVIPCHFRQFTFNTEEPDEFVSACERVGQKYHLMRGGERIRIK